MVMKCCVTTCKIQKDDHGCEVSFHKLPARESIREEWMKVLKKHCPSINQKYLYVCSQHFEKECFQYSGLCKKRMLKSGSIPTIFFNFKVVECEKQYSRTPSLKKENSLNRPEQCNLMSFTDEQIGFLPKQNENFEKLGELQNKCQSNSDKIEILATDPNSEKVLKHNPSEDILSFSKAGNNEESETEKRQRHKIEMLQRRNRNLTVQLGRCRRKLYRFKSLFEDIRRKKFISDEENAALQEAIPIEDRPIFNKIINTRRSKRPLPSSLRKFACTLDFYSPKAYKYVRKTYMKCLPHQKTISRWYRKIHIDSGVSRAVITAVKNKVDKSADPIFCNLVFDEMSVRKKIETINGIEYGYVDVGKGDAADNAIVCMLVCVNGNWKIPISYYFITSLTAKEKREIVDEALRALHETGARIISLTFDGPQCNLAMCSLLGARLNVDGPVQNYFHHPITNEPVFIILDACHSLKSVRNSVGNGDKDMYDREGNIISWSYFENLISLQTRHAELYLAHRMTEDHINWQENKMNVRLAAQTFIQSVSDALHYLEYETNICEFKGAAGTSKFCKMMNAAFDILNSRTLFSNDPSKNGINNNNIEVVEKKVHDIVDYIKGLKYLDGNRVVLGKRKTGFIGIILGLHSVVGIFKHYIQKDIPNGYLLTYKLSQDHLQIFFSAVRSKGGHNNNPTCRLFISIFKQLLLHADIQGSDNGNCMLLDKTELLRISDVSVSNIQQDYGTRQNDIAISKIVSLPQNKLYVHDAVCYTAGFVCRRLLKITKCFICPFVLTHQREFSEKSNEKSQDGYRSRLIDIKNRGSLIYPSADVITICKISENIFKACYTSRKGIFKQLVKLSQQNIPRSCLKLNHSFSEKVDASSHRSQLLTKIISIYLQMRINKYEKQKRKPQKRLRRLYTKYILFNHE